MNKEIAKQEGGLLSLSEEELSEIIEALPVKKRSAFGKAVQAAIEYANDQKLYDEMYKLAVAAIENEWHLGKELPTVIGGKGQPKKYNSNYITLDELGVSLRRSSLAQRIASSFTKPQVVKWAKEHIDHDTHKVPRVTSCATEAKRRQQVADNEALEESELPPGAYSVIVIDPPWPMEKIERDAAPHQASFDYPTMDEDALSGIELPAADDCHMWLWTTHRFLPMALRLVPVWGFKYVCTFVWHKPGGFQPFGLPQYNCEFALYCRKGTPKFKTTKDFKLCFDAPRGEHSEKPESFYDMVRRVTSGKRIDMFNRRKITGFKGWGNEAG